MVSPPVLRSEALLGRVVKGDHGLEMRGAAPELEEQWRAANQGKHLGRGEGR